MAKATAKSCFSRAVRTCRKYTKRRGYSSKDYHNCMSGTLKSRCYGHRRRKKRRKER